MFGGCGRYQQLTALDLTHAFSRSQRKAAQRPHVKRPLALPSDDMEQVNELVLQVRSTRMHMCGGLVCVWSTWAWMCGGLRAWVLALTMPCPCVLTMCFYSRWCVVAFGARCPADPRFPHPLHRLPEPRCPSGAPLPFDVVLVHDDDLVFA